MKKFLVSCLILTIMVGVCVNVSAYTAPDYLKLNVIERTGWTASCKGEYLPDTVKNTLDGFARWGADGAAFKLNGGGTQGAGALIGDYIQIDMKSSHIIDKTIIINTFYTPMNRFKIFLSETEITDTTSMTPVATVEGCAKNYEVPSPFNVEGLGNQIIRFAPQSARYIRFEIYENTGWMDIDEINVGTPWSMPNNMALTEKTGFTATAISTYSGYNVNNLFDNAVGAGHNWACENRKNGHWIAVDMKAPTLTNGIALITNDSPNYKHARSFKVYLSDDEVYTADEIVTTTDSGSEGLTVVSWPATTKQYMKIEIDKDNGDWWNLDEIEFYSPMTIPASVALSKDGWVASAVSLYDDGGGSRGVPFLIDNNLETPWAVAMENQGRTKGNWVALDMKAEQKINGIRLYTKVDDPKSVKNFRVYASNTPFTDASCAAPAQTANALELLAGTTQVATVTNGKSGYQLVQFANPVNARYIKIVANEESTVVGNDWWNLNEIDVYVDIRVDNIVSFSFPGYNTLKEFEDGFKRGDVFNSGSESTPVTIDVSAFGNKNLIGIVAKYKNGALKTMDILNRVGDECKGNIAINETDSILKVFLLENMQDISPMLTNYTLERTK